MRIYCFLFLSLCLFTSTMYAQKIATLEVELNHPTAGLVIPAQVELDALTTLGESELALVHVKDGKAVPVPSRLQKIKTVAYFTGSLILKMETGIGRPFNSRKGRAVTRPH